jgi:mannose-6-phosphate isomerase-like protein (cupin superfamily)
VFTSKGWQVADVNQQMVADGSMAFVPLTELRDSAVILNCYPVGHHDDMHCHPNEEHVFLVYRGRLHLTGVEDGEDVVLEAGELVHIDNNYYYRLHNPGPEPAVYYQFRTLPKNHPKRRMVPFSESARGKRSATAQNGRT